CSSDLPTPWRGALRLLRVWLGAATVQRQIQHAADRAKERQERHDPANDEQQPATARSIAWWWRCGDCNGRRERGVDRKGIATLIDSWPTNDQQVGARPGLGAR